MTWKIHAITGDLTGQEISIDRDMLVGRHQAADIVLQAAEISRKHATFLLKDDALWVQDLGSSNGTFVNDVQIAQETLLKQDDIVQFASLKFSVLAPVGAVEVPAEIEATAEKVVEQVEVAEPTPAQQMNDQGIPELRERDASVNLTRDGMPTNVGIPKPAPIAEGVDLSSVKPEPAPIPVEQPVSRVEQEKEAQKNASIGLISLIVLIILAIIAWVLFK
ncbi:FHA domain-containing protein [Acinetobacter variabilis]|uniref:FHA domain-containing protein n=1 Tax=Acinetobacter variabilis TaxID=70346 RepID=UPI003AF524DF